MTIIVMHIFWAGFYLFFPVLVLYLCHTYSVFEKLGAAAICFLVGMVLANIGIIPDGIKNTQSIIMTITVPLAIPLMLFPTDLRRWIKLAGKSLLSFVLIIFSVMAATTIGYVLLQNRVDEAAKIGGMFVGGFTGATVNFMGVAMALKTTSETIVLTTASSWLLEIFWLLFIMFLGQRIIGKFLPRFTFSPTAEPIDTAETNEAYEREKIDLMSYQGIFTRKKFIRMLGALGTAMIIFAVGAGLYSITPEIYNMTVLMLSVSTLGILCSFVPAIRKIEMSFQLGQYIILIFCITIASTVDFSELLNASLAILGYTCIALVGMSLIHILLCKIFKIDTDTQIITATAGIFSPIFVPMVASSLKNTDIIVPGLAAGIIGYAIGNYLGISFSYLLMALS
ncbi:MAG: DUF819 family protein [Deltaproteobacteria bacterium]|nr:DUF819 family protein [Deltaproteobacteria bacterium]